MMAMGVKMKMPKFINFARNVAPQLFPTNYCDAALEESLQVLLDIERCQVPIYDFLISDKNYVGLTHQNMNIDNAFFWRAENGEVESGFIDWGRFRNDNYASAMMNGFGCCDLPEFMVECDRKLLQYFCDVYAEEHKPGVVKFEGLWECYMVNWCLQSLFLVNLADTGIYPSWEHTRQECWHNIKHYKDPRIHHMPNCNAGWIAMIRQFAHHWKAKDLPNWWNAWRKKNCAHILTPAQHAEEAAKKKAAKMASKKEKGGHA